MTEADKLIHQLARLLARQVFRENRGVEHETVQAASVKQIRGRSYTGHLDKDTLKADQES